MKNYNKLFKWLLVAMIVISVALLVWGFAVGFESNGGQAVDVLFYWAYIMIAFAAIAVIALGLIIGFKNNPKSIVKLLLGLVAVAAVCFVVYLISPGKPAMGMPTQPDQSTLRLTDTILNLTYIAGALAIVSIIVGEVVMSIRNKK